MSQFQVLVLAPSLPLHHSDHFLAMATSDKASIDTYGDEEQLVSRHAAEPPR